MAVNATSARVRTVAVELFAGRGFHGVGIRELAQRARLSPASLYHYIGTKEALLAGIMRDCLERLLTAAHEAVDPINDPRLRLSRLVALHVLAHAVHAQETAVVDNEVHSLSPALREPVVALRDDYERLWETAIFEASEAGMLRPDPTGVARRGLLEMCSGVARWYSRHGSVSLDRIAREYVRLALRALGAAEDAAEEQVDPDLERCHRIVADTWNTSTL